MLNRSLWIHGNSIVRVLDEKENMVLVIDCAHLSMPRWETLHILQQYHQMDEADWKRGGCLAKSIDELSHQAKQIMHERFTTISSVLPFVGDERKRTQMIAMTSEIHGVSQKSVRRYLCKYLAFQSILALAPGNETRKPDLSKDEKNIRWALNKFYYTKNRNSLRTAYTLMLKERYCDEGRNLLPEYPSFHQFRYFYRKNKSLQDYYISREGMKQYQRDHRPLLGDGVQEYASHVGVAMLDSTICDIYLVNEVGGLVGRPTLTACIDAYSGLCCGYTLSWEGGTYSLRGLMLSVIEDKAAYCKRFGITIGEGQWDCEGMLPGTLVTDMGSEYASQNFEQIAKLGVTVVNLPAYRPELKGVVEKFFDLIQNAFKPHLKDKGFIEPDYQERGAHDYRKDACLTMEQFEKVVLNCVLYYNGKRIIENYPYTDDMLVKGVQPYAAAIWNYGRKHPSADLIPVSREQLILTLLPRTTGRFSRSGLKVNQMRYRHDDYTEQYLQGREAVVAYNPDDVGCVWLVEKGEYVRFDLIEGRYAGKELNGVRQAQESRKRLVRAAQEENLQAQIDLADLIETIAGTAKRTGDIKLKNIRGNRSREQLRKHRDYYEGRHEGCDSKIQMQLAGYMADAFAAPLSMENPTPVGDFLHSKMAWTKYRSVRGEQRNIALLAHDFEAYYCCLPGNDFFMDWQIQKVLNNHKPNFKYVCMLAMFLNIEPAELANISLPEKTQEQLFDEQVRKLHEAGMKYPAIAERIGAPYDLVKAIGEGRYGTCHKPSRIQQKCGQRELDWEALDRETLPRVKASDGKLLLRDAHQLLPGER